MRKAPLGNPACTTSGGYSTVCGRALVGEMGSGDRKEVPIQGQQLARELLAVWRDAAALPEAARPFRAFCQEWT